MRLWKLVAIGFAALSVSTARAEEDIFRKALDGCDSELKTGSFGTCAMGHVDSLLPNWKSNAAVANALLKMFDFMNDGSGKLGKGEWSDKVFFDNFKLAYTRMNVELEQAVKVMEQAKAGHETPIDTNTLLLLMMMQGQQPQPQPQPQLQPMPMLRAPPTYHTNCTTDRRGNVNCTTMGY